MPACREFSGSTRARRVLSPGPREVYHARFKVDGKWHTVKNPMGNPISYATKQAAQDAAKFVGAAWRLEQSRKATPECPREAVP